MSLEELFTAVEDYIRRVRIELHTRWDEWTFNLARAEVHKVVGALMARQVTIATQLASNPSIWNGHIAPTLLRTMVDVYIMLAWILQQPLDRSRKYVLYGLGQEKPFLENLKASLTEEEFSENHLVVEAVEAWIHSQRFTFLTNVNVGSWSGLSTRAMAQESGCMGVYRHAYTPFSSSAHSTWNHVAKYNLQPCSNPLHRYHMVPVDSDMPLDPDYLYRVAKYVDKTFVLFESTFEITPRESLAFQQLTTAIEKFSAYNKDSDEDPKV